MSDPGIIPRNIGPGKNPITYNQHNSTGHSLPVFGPGGWREILVGPKKELAIAKWCITCNIWRGLRTSHCSFCNCCVDRHDHHCPWLSNCIGSNNYRFFYGFITSSIFMCLICLIFTFLHLSEISDNDLKDNQVALSKTSRMLLACQLEPLLLLLIVATLLAIWIPLVLFSYHTLLITQNKTTHEALRKSEGRRGSSLNPWSRSCLYNWGYSLFRLKIF